MRTKQILSITFRHFQLSKSMCTIKEGKTRFIIVWRQNVNPEGKIVGVGCFAQQKYTYQKRVPGAGMKKRIRELNRK